MIYYSDNSARAWREQALKALIDGDDSLIVDPRLYSIKDEVWEENLAVVGGS